MLYLKNQIIKSQNDSDKTFKKVSIVFLYFIDDSLKTSRREILMKNNLGKDLIFARHCINKFFKHS